MATRAGTSTGRIQRAAAQATGTAPIATVGPMTGRYEVSGAQIRTGAGPADWGASVTLTILIRRSGSPSQARHVGTHGGILCVKLPNYASSATTI